MSQTNRLSVVTGAGSGIGRAIALGLADREGPVGVLDFDGASAQETTSLIIRATGKP